VGVQRAQFIVRNVSCNAGDRFAHVWNTCVIDHRFGCNTTGTNTRATLFLLPFLLSRVDGKFQSQNPMHRISPKRSTTQPTAKPSRLKHRASAVTPTTIHRTGGVAEYSGAYWKKHSDGMKTPFVIKYGFGLRTIANHSTDRCCLSYWQFMIRNVRLLISFSPLGIPDPDRHTAPAHCTT